MGDRHKGSTPVMWHVAYGAAPKDSTAREWVMLQDCHMRGGVQRSLVREGFSGPWRSATARCCSASLRAGAARSFLCRERMLGRAWCPIPVHLSGALGWNEGRAASRIFRFMWWQLQCRKKEWRGWHMAVLPGVSGRAGCRTGAVPAPRLAGGKMPPSGCLPPVPPAVLITEAAQSRLAWSITVCLCALWLCHSIFKDINLHFEACRALQTFYACAEHYFF